MNFRLTGILALIAAFLGLLIIFWDRDDDTERSRLEQARRAFRFDPARVDRLLVSSGDLSIECRLRNGQWLLVHPIAARADPVAIERLLGALQELPRGDIILPPRRTLDPYAPYGLDDPRATLSIIEGSVTNRILIGRRTPLGDGVYVRQSDHPGLARINTSLLDLLPASADALRDRSLLSGSHAAIERLDIRGPAGYIQLARDPQGTWRIFQPFASRIDSASITALVETLLSCSVSLFIQDAVSDLSPYGLDSQSAVTAVLNTDSGDGSQMLSLGDPLPNDPTLVYARLQAENSIYAVPVAVRQALLVRPDDLRDRRLPGIDPEAIQGIRIEESETVLEVSRDDNDVWQLLAPIRAPADPEAIHALIRSWSDVRLSSFDTPSPNPADLPFTRTIRIDLRNPEAEPLVFNLGPNPQDPGTVRISIDGDSSAALATTSLLLDFSLNPVAYRSREIFYVPASDISSIRIDASNQTHRLVRDASTGQWSPAVPWLDRLLSSLTPLRAQSLVAEEPPHSGLDKPMISLTLHLRGKSGLATTLLVGNEIAPGGPRWATVRGRDLVFTLSPLTVESLLPPPVQDP